MVHADIAVTYRNIYVYVVRINNVTIGLLTMYKNYNEIIIKMVRLRGFLYHDWC